MVGSTTLRAAGADATAWGLAQTNPLAQFQGITREEVVDTVIGYVATVATFVLAFLVVYLLGSRVVAPLVRRVLSSRGFDETVESLGESIVNAAVVFAAVAVAFTVSGFGAFLTAFATFGSALALAVGFAAQDLIGNFVAGIFILKDKPFEVGDWIEWSDGEGIVRDIDLRVTRVQTFDNEQITVPNSDLATDAIVNPVAYRTLRGKFTFGIGYDDDIAHARECILEEARGVDDILDDPGPSIRVTELGDSAVGLQARYWIEDPTRGDYVGARSELVAAVKERFDAEGIDMPYVHRQLTGDVTVVDGPAEEPARPDGGE
ncbi:mechanosensitive ion channel family protein [Halobaculum sp. MBLA0147]|uniref:mechanosensitive ion channel family protein n=1 Tax=Halobaculum sp. MBLA0147 TaxID=3079934 RepID=UPI0035261AF2